MKIDQITIGTRHRKDMGDVDGLALSIRAIGLLHPIILNPSGELVAGARRLAAVRMLGWNEVETRTVETLDDLAAALRAERDENTCRKDFTPSEAVKMAEALEPFEKKAAQERKKDHGKTAPGKSAMRIPSAEEILGPTKNTPEKFTEVKGEAKAKVAEAVGMSRPTLEKAQAVVAAAKADPVHYGDLPKKMDKTGKVAPAFKEAQQRAEQHPVPSVPKLIPRERSAGEKFHKSLSGLHRDFIAIRENHGIEELTQWWSDDERVEYARQLRMLAAEALEWAGILEKAKCHRKTA